MRCSDSGVRRHLCALYMLVHILPVQYKEIVDSRHRLSAQPTHDVYELGELSKILLKSMQ